MAKCYYISNATSINDVRNALLDYYGEYGVTIVSETDTALEFVCPAVCDKTLKFARNNAGFNAFCEGTQFSYSSYGVPDGFYLILSGAFLLLEIIGNDNSGNSALAARLTNGRYMCAGGTDTTTSTTAAYEKNKCMFTDTMVIRPIRMLSPHPYNVVSKGRLCLYPAYVADDREVVLNEDGSFASIPGLYITSKQGAPILGGNYFLSRSGLRGTSAEGLYRTTQLFIGLSDNGDGSVSP